MIQEMREDPKAMKQNPSLIQLQDPRFEILKNPTPLQRLERTECKLDHSGLYVKRDDMMEVAIGGNKLRSLEFWVGEALREAADVLLVAGGPTSNQCRLTAAAAAIAGLDCIVFHNAISDPTSERDSFLNKVLGASVRFLVAIDETQRAEEVTKAANQLRQDGRRPYIVGNAVIGGLGYVRAAEELLLQSRASGADIRHVILPGSMGPTEAGFIFGNHLLGNPFHVHLISVEYGQAELAARIDKIFRGLAAHTGLGGAKFDDAHLHIHMDYLGAGYGKPSAACEKAIMEFARTEGFFLEHTYTGKTFAGFLDLIQGGVIPKGEAACVIHTGGVPALFSQFELFQSLSH